MGGSTSDLSQVQLEELQACSTFNTAQIGRLYKRFKRLDKDGTGLITNDELLAIPELALNPLLKRVIALFDPTADGVTFKQFVQTLSVFNIRAPAEQKMRFAFRVYDEDNDGFISNMDLFHVLKMMVGDNLREDQLQQIVDKTISEADLDQDGRISYDEFNQVMASTDIETKMSIRF